MNGSESDYVTSTIKGMNGQYDGTAANWHANQDRLENERLWAEVHRQRQLSWQAEENAKYNPAMPQKPGKTPRYEEPKNFAECVNAGIGYGFAFAIVAIFGAWGTIGILEAITWFIGGIIAGGIIGALVYGVPILLRWLARAAMYVAIIGVALVLLTP